MKNDNEWGQRHIEFRCNRNADQVELLAIRNRQSQLEAADLDERITEELDGFSGDGEYDSRFQKIDVETESIVGGAREAIELRIRQLGDLYPFKLVGNSLNYIPSDKNWPYLFCLMASLAEDLKPNHIRLRACFELVALEAIRAFVGNGAKGFRTGYPWDIYSHALNTSKLVYEKLRETCEDEFDWSWSPIDGIEADPPATRAKDLGVDVVVWKSMPDNRGGNAYTLCQCATGQDIEGKATDLSLNDLKEFVRLPDAEPQRSIATPHFITNSQHVRSISRKGGLLFDRFRIVTLLSTFKEFTDQFRNDAANLVKELALLN